MKKILVVIFSLFLLTGCTSVKLNTGRIESDISKTVSYVNVHSNTTGSGFKYYKPRDFSLYKSDEYNHVLTHNGDKYYLTIDINAYYLKYKTEHIEDENYVYSLNFEYDGKKGYVDVISKEDNYFYVKMLYNYSSVDVVVKESRINDTIINGLVLLTSINYNEKVINTIISNSDIESKEEVYKIKEPVETKEVKSVLEVYDYNN